jgi:hypothetical protein
MQTQSGVITHTVGSIICVDLQLHSFIHMFFQLILIINININILPHPFHFQNASNFHYLNIAIENIGS